MTDSLLDILDLERIEDRMFRGRTRPTDVPRIFGRASPIRFRGTSCPLWRTPSPTPTRVSDPASTACGRGSR